MNTNLKTYSCMAAMLCLVAAAGKMTYALSNVTQENNQDVLQAIDDASHLAAEKQKNVSGLKRKKSAAEEAMQKADRKLQELNKKKRQLRLRMAKKVERAKMFQEQYGVDPLNEAELESFVAEQRAELETFVEGYVRYSQLVATTDDASLGDVLMPKLTGISLGEQVESGLRQRALARARMRLLKDMTAMSVLPRIMGELREEHEAVLVEYQAALEEYDKAAYTVTVSDDELKEIKRIQAAVDSEIAAMQSKLAEYDAEIRRRAEQALIAKGLRSKSGSATSATPHFMWPVVGRLTATYFDKSYQEHFGVPHKAIDISQPQGSAVKAAEDGIVHRVKDGGQYGYSYILIGHRGGYATLYGHMSQMWVTAGQSVTKGQTIGLSGGQPGSYGAGPMTTGAHLHFEVIKDGVHVNPTSVLP